MSLYRSALVVSLCVPRRPVRTDVPSMYAEDDAFEEEFARAADIRQSRASLTRGSRYYTEGFVQYSQPSLNGTYEQILHTCDDLQWNTPNTTIYSPLTSLSYRCSASANILMLIGIPSFLQLPDLVFN